MSEKQRILVFQQNDSGRIKTAGIHRYGKGRMTVEVVSVDGPLPDIIDDTSDYLPGDIDADLVLDFLQHPDLSEDLAALCRKRGIPVVASGKKLRGEGVYAPPT